MLKDTYRISVNSAKRLVSISVGELSSPDAAKKFMEEYQSKTSFLNASVHTLTVDCRDMKVTTPELAKSVEEAFRLYNKTGFKKIEFIIQKNVILKMQLSRLARAAGLTNFEVNQEGE